MTFRHRYYGEKDTFKTVFNALNLSEETAGDEVGTEAYKNTVASKKMNIQKLIVMPNPQDCLCVGIMNYVMMLILV
jgi:hypothetical protein